MYLESCEPVVAYDTVIEMLSDSICAGAGWDQCDHHQPINIGRLLIPKDGETYIARVTGESMKGIGIYDDDLILINHVMPVTSGSIVAVSLNGGTLVKRIRFREGGPIILESENDDFPDVDISEHSCFVVLGLVTSVTRMYV